MKWNKNRKFGSVAAFSSGPLRVHWRLTNQRSHDPTGDWQQVNVLYDDIIIDRLFPSKILQLINKLNKFPKKFFTLFIQRSLNCKKSGSKTLKTFDWLMNLWSEWLVSICWLRWRIRSTMRRPKFQSSRTARTKDGRLKTSREPFCSWTHRQHLEDASQSDSSARLLVYYNQRKITVFCVWIKYFNPLLCFKTKTAIINQSIH